MAMFAHNRLTVLTATVLLAACASTSNTVTSRPPAVEREFRGVWVAAVNNIDWPSRPGLPADTQKAELIRLLDRTKQLGMNAFILHVRPAGDALYDSKLEPWSEFLTGTQGQAPEPFYDPLEFAVREAHARGLELHAWFNPYRARHPAGRSELAQTHVARAQPELVKQYGSYLWMDPGEDAVRNRTVEVIVDVTRRYDVDGVHIDDYFYPYRERGPDGKELDFPDSVSYAKYLARGGKLSRSDWRRGNVDRFIKQMYKAVKKEKPWVKVGVSPIGTWRPGVTPQTRGFDAYESIYADSRKWFMEGDLDYFVPQLYWPIARTDASFAIVLDWWARQNPKNRALYAGMIPGSVSATNWPADEIISQIYVTRAHPGSHGQVHFSMRSLMPNSFRAIPGADTLPQARLDSLNTVRAATQARRDSMTSKIIREAYARPALIPAMRWLDGKAPRAPKATLQQLDSNTHVTLMPAGGEQPQLWVVQSKWPRGWWRTEILPASQKELSIVAPTADWGTPVEVWVSAVDRLGNQSRAVRANN